MARKGVGGITRLVFGLVGLAMVAVAVVIWIQYVIAPSRAAATGDKKTVTLSQCGGSGPRSSCHGAWAGGSGDYSGSGENGQKLQAYVHDGKAYGSAREDWTGRAVLGAVGIGLAVVARYLVLTSIRGRSK